MPGIRLRVAVQEMAGGARDCGEVQAWHRDGAVTGEQKYAAPASAAGEKSRATVGRTKWPA